MRQKRILLAFVEAVNLVDKHNGAFGVQRIASGQGLVHCLTDFFHTTEHRTDGQKLRIKSVSHQPCDGGFAHPRWTPQNATVGLARFKSYPEGHALAQHLLLPNHFAQAARAQALCQRDVRSFGTHGAVVKNSSGPEHFDAGGWAELKTRWPQTWGVGLDLIEHQNRALAHGIGHLQTRQLHPCA